jgi:hypothetical protein
MAYWDKLETEWRANRKNGRAGAALERPKSLRGRDFVDELHRLAVLTGDRRFYDALMALAEHGIVDTRMNFKRWRAPAFAEMERESNRVILMGIRFLMKLGKSQRRACAEVAAVTGRPSASFDAAVTDLRKLHAKLGKIS